MRMKINLNRKIQNLHLKVKSIIMAKNPSSINQQKKTKKPDYIRTVGRRKTSVARIRLFEGSGEDMVNNRPSAEYFPGITNQTTLSTPFRTINKLNKFYFTVKVEGGGVNSQVTAVADGIARALVKLDEANKPALKIKGLLTRDPRMKERRKPGYAQSARARKQSPKR